MHCFVFASQRKANTYLWLAQKDGVKTIPESLAVMLGDLRFVLELELHAERRLPHEDVQVVMEHLRTQGWHLQLPPQETLASAPNHSHEGISDRDVEDTAEPQQE
jgi:uncharacterized protein